MLKDATELWQIYNDSVELMASAGTMTYRAQRAQRQGATVYLRLSDPAFRTQPETEAECDVVLHLHRAGARVATPLLSLNGRYVEPLADGWTAVVFREAPGRLVRQGDALWDEPFFRAWGKALADIHRAGVTFQPLGSRQPCTWNEDFWLRQADRFLPRDDVAARREFEVVMTHIAALPQNPALYGLTHGDFAPANFNYAPQIGVTAFDFGNLGYHWFVSDIAISLSIVLWAPDEEREQVKNGLLAGYQEAFPLDLAELRNGDW